jgi:hypothetical protein
MGDLQRECQIHMKGAVGYTIISNMRLKERVIPNTTTAFDVTFLGHFFWVSV